jgi:hypothetical protein
MPLLDHFVDADPRANWESFHHRWAVAIADQLDQSLPRRFFASVEIHLGTDVAADVAEFETVSDHLSEVTGNGVALQTYAPPMPAMVKSQIDDDETEIQIREATPRSRLLAVIELISPSNKHGPEQRGAFVAKCAAYLKQRIGLVIVDTVTNRRFNLHNELIRFKHWDESFLLPNDPPIYVVSYGPTVHEGKRVLEMWPHILELGLPVPTVPLRLKGYGCIALDLESTYMETCRRTRLI